ncbi:MAG: hypothetical protein ACE5JU_25215, partial [Candidatus Binatia bacterium]
VTSISWLWWNLTGFAATVLVTAMLSGWDKSPRKNVRLEPSGTTQINWPQVYIWIVVYFFVIVGLSRILETLG